MKTLKHSSLLCLLILFPFLIFAQECDTIVLHSGHEIIVQDLVELSDQFQYTKCGQDTVTIYSMKREKINFIKYAPISFNRYLIQDSSLVYEAWVYSNQYSQIAKGYLYTLHDSSVVVSASDMLNPPKNQLSEIAVQDVHLLKLKDKKHLRRSLRIGAISGFLVGGTVGLVVIQGLKDIGKSSRSNANSSAFVPALAFGSAGALGGLIVGGILGSITTTIPIHGKQDRYKRERERLKKRWL